jgi:DNA-binding MarR family transcriptional regulator
MDTPTSTRGRKARTITQDDYEHLADFRFALRSFLHFSESAAREAGLTPQQHQALLAIKASERRGVMNITMLAERLLLRHHSVVELVNRLEQGGYVVRQGDPDDSRKIALKLTAQAQRVLRQLSAAHLDELGSLGPVLHPILRRLGRDGKDPGRAQGLADEVP